MAEEVSNQRVSTSPLSPSAKATAQTRFASPSARPVLSASGNGLLAPGSHRGSVAPSRAPSPGPSISPNKKEKDDALLDCLNCSRQVSFCSSRCRRFVALTELLYRLLLLVTLVT